MTVNHTIRPRTDAALWRLGTDPLHGAVWADGTKPPMVRGREKELLAFAPVRHQDIGVHTAESGREVPGSARGVGGRERSIRDGESAAPGGSKNPAAAAIVDCSDKSVAFVRSG